MFSPLQSSGLPGSRWFVTAVAAAGIVLCVLPAARAEEPKATAVLTESETAVGRPVQLEIQVNGASSAKPPGEIVVEGLEIRSGGVSRHYQMQNFKVSYNFTYTYSVMPMKAGTFKIPPQTVEAGGKTLRTPELILNVVNSPGQSARSGRNRASSNIDPAQIGFVEMMLPKSTAYVGEMIPVQVRLALNMRAPIESLGSGVQIAGQGFTTQKMPEPRQTVETVNGRNYQVFIFKTAVAAARPGKLEIGPAQINPIVRVPRAGQRNPSLPRDIFDDPFFNNLFNDPAFAPSMPKEVHLKSEPHTIEVKPLPPNPPASFSGAVGNFTMKADANPKSATVGDPLTIIATITGRGNFDRVTAPVMEDERGWHKYPPSDAFKQDDDVGISGAKTFETVVSAKEKKEKLPPSVFSYFDPVKENYVTLRSDEVPVRIDGGALPSATPMVTTAPAPSASAAPPSATPAPPSKVEGQDILTHLDNRPDQVRSFTPLYRRQGFWVAQLLPLMALLAFILNQLRTARLADRAVQQLVRLQQETAALQRKLRNNGVTPQQYMADASRMVQLKTALARKVDPNSVDAEIAASAFRLDEAARHRLRLLFAERDQLRYSGEQNGAETISTRDRKEIIELVESLRA